MVDIPDFVRSALDKYLADDCSYAGTIVQLLRNNERPAVGWLERNMKDWGAILNELGYGA